MRRPTSIAAERHVAVSGHAAATASAVAILDGGGSVADAAIAGAAVLAVVLPNAAALGGDVMALVHEAAAGETHGLNASGPAPRAIGPDQFTAGVPLTGPLSVTVPGAAAGWQALHRKFGRLPWRDVLAPAIDLAREGIAISPGLARAIAAAEGELRADPGCRALFLPAGRVPVAGTVLRQPGLAACLTDIAAGGADAFYRGRHAETIARAVRAAGGLLAAEDFAEYEAEWVRPLAISFAGHRIAALPPNSYGLYLLLQLRAIEALALSPQPEMRIPALHRAALAAFETGGAAVADPYFGAASAEALLASEEEHLKLLTRARAGAGRMPRDAGGTAGLVVADCAGNAVALLQSVKGRFGSLVADAESGVVLNNRLSGFGDGANAPAAGKRPANTLCPTMAFGAHGLHLALATPGGPGQTVTLAQILDSILRHARDPADAVGDPRWSVDRAHRPIVEESAPPAMRAVLARGLVPFTAAPAGDPFFGAVSAIVRDRAGGLRGIADGRREIAAAGR